MHSYNKGKLLISIAKGLGCKHIKFQLWRADDLYKDTEIYTITKKLELDMVLAEKFYNYGKLLDINVFFSVFYPEAVKFCERLGVKYYKISNAFTRNKEIVELVLFTGKPVFMSFSNQYPIDKKLMVHKQVIPLYTIPKYPPCPSDFDNILLKDIIRHGGGYSNHFPDLYYPSHAYLLGARWIELHLRLHEGCSDSPDFGCSLNPYQLNRFMSMVKKGGR